MVENKFIQTVGQIPGRSEGQAEQFRLEYGEALKVYREIQ